MRAFWAVDLSQCFAITRWRAFRIEVAEATELFGNRQNKPEHGTAIIDQIAPVGRAADHRQHVTSVRDYLQVSRVRVVIVLVILASLCAAFLLLRSLPPRTIVMVTGPEGGAYAEVGPRYREILGRAGIEVKLLPTGGEFENLARLRDPRSGVSVGFIQGDITTQKESPDLEAHTTGDAEIDPGRFRPARTRQ
jgi:hypothetical protein